MVGISAGCISILSERLINDLPGNADVLEKALTGMSELPAGPIIIGAGICLATGIAFSIRRQVNANKTS